MTSAHWRLPSANLCPLVMWNRRVCECSHCIFACMQWRSVTIAAQSYPSAHLHSMWSILCIDHIRHLVCIECVIFWYPIHTCYVWDQAVQQDFFIRWDWCILYWNILSSFSCDIWIQIYTTKYSNLLLIILIISLNCLQHIQKRRNFDAKVTCHQPICLLLHDILSGVGVIHRCMLWYHISLQERGNRLQSVVSNETI